MFSKERAQKVSGFSERQLNISLRVANIPEHQFTEQVVSVNPPTLTDLARFLQRARAWAAAGREA